MQYTAYGHFVHPVETVDLTKRVTWTSNVPGVATVDANGVVTASHIDAGGTIITATANKGIIGPGRANEIIFGQATFTVSDPDPTTHLCP